MKRRDFGKALAGGVDRRRCCGLAHAVFGKCGTVLPGKIR